MAGPEPKIEKGMLLVHREAPRNGLPERFNVWTVARVRQAKKWATVTLLSHDGAVITEATARFPDGVVREPFRVFRLSANYKERIWANAWLAAPKE